MACIVALCSLALFYMLITLHRWLVAAMAFSSWSTSVINTVCNGIWTAQGIRTVSAQRTIGVYETSLRTRLISTRSRAERYHAQFIAARSTAGYNGDLEPAMREVMRIYYPAFCCRRHAADRQPEICRSVDASALSCAILIYFSSFFLQHGRTVVRRLIIIIIIIINRFV